MTRNRLKAAVFLICCLLPVNVFAQTPVHSLDTLFVRAVSRLPHAAQSAFRSVDVVDRNQISQLPGRTIAEVVARILGVDVVPRSPAQADMSIRGSSFEQVLMLVDGLRVSDEQTGHFDLDLAVPLENVERIEVLRGPGSAVYGSDAVGGVVNIVTRRSQHATANVQGGSFGAATTGVSIGTPDLQIAGDYARSDGHRAGTDYVIYQTRAALSRLIPSGRLGLDIGIGVRDFGAADFYAPFESHERTQSFTLVARHEPSGLTGWQFAPQVNVRHHTDRFTLKREDPAFYQNEHESWQTGLELVARQVNDRAGLVVGSELFVAGLESARLGDRLEKRAALFTEATLGDPRTAAFNAGVRADWGNTFHTFASPSVALALRAGENIGLRASASRGFRVPTWTERYYSDPANVADPALEPERFWAGEIGARVQAGKYVTADAAAFYRNATQLIDWAKPTDAAESTPWRTMNIEEANFRGVEVRVGMTDILGVRPGVRAMALSMDAADADGYVSKYALRQITQQIAVTLEVPAKLFPLAASAELARSRRRLEGSFLKADARVRWNVGDFRVDVDLTNLTNADYLDASAKPVAGRALGVAINWNRTR